MSLEKSNDIMKKHICNICNCEYKSYQSLWNHKHRMHDDNQQFTTPNINKSTLDINTSTPNINTINCKFCQREFSFIQSRWRHEKTCKKNDKKLLETAIQKINDLEKEIKDLKKEKQIVTSNSNSNNNKTINNNNNGTINNAKIINNNINIVAPGNENNDLTNDEIKSIFEKQLSSVIRYIELTNFNKNRPMNHSFCVTNRDGKHVLAYNTDTATVESNKKKYFYASVLSKAISRMESIVNNKNLMKKQFTKEKQQMIKEGIERLKDICDKDYNSKILKSLYDELNLLCYNSRKTVLSTWENPQDTNDSTEDYKNIFMPIKDFIEIYSNDVLKEQDMQYSESDSDSDTETKPELIIRKKKNSIEV